MSCWLEAGSPTVSLHTDTAGSQLAHLSCRAQILELSMPEGADARLFRLFLTTFIGPMFARCSSRIEDLQARVWILAHMRCHASCLVLRSTASHHEACGRSASSAVSHRVHGRHTSKPEAEMWEPLSSFMEDMVTNEPCLRCLACPAAAG